MQGVRFCCGEQSWPRDAHGTRHKKKDEVDVIVDDLPEDFGGKAPVEKAIGEMSPEAQASFKKGEEVKKA